MELETAEMRVVPMVVKKEGQRVALKAGWTVAALVGTKGVQSVA